MDVFAHALWTNVVFYSKYRQEKMRRWLAIFFGVAPDLVSFAPAFLYLFFSRSHFSIETFNSQVWVFKYAAHAYNFTHSLVIFIAAMIIVAAIRRGKIYWPMWGWGLHIFIDIFSHKNFYETPFLFPLSNYKIGLLSWGHPLFMSINYGLLALAYLFWFFVLRKKYAKQA